MKTKFLIGFILATLVIFSPVKNISAEAVIVSSPADLALDVKQNQEIEKTVTIENQTEEVLNIKSALAESKVADTEDAIAKDQQVQLDKIITWQPNEFTIDEKGKQDVLIKIKTPEDYPIGNIETAIAFQPEVITAGVSKDKQTAALEKAILKIAIKVGEKDVRSGQLMSVQVSVEGNDFKKISSGGELNQLFRPKVEVNSVFKNTGNLEMDLSGYADFNCVIGNKSYKEKREIQESGIVAGTEKNIKVSWDRAPLLGICSVKVAVAYTNDEYLSLIRDFNIYNAPLLSAIFLGLLIAVIILGLIIRKRKKRRFVEKYKKNKDADDTFGWEEMGKKSEKSNCAIFIIIFLLILAVISAMFYQEIKNGITKLITKEDRGGVVIEKNTEAEKADQEKAQVPEASKDETKAADDQKKTEAAGETKPVQENLPADNTAVVTPPAAPEYETYTIVDGDLLGSIATKYKTTVAEILKLNPEIKDENFISIGQ